MPTTTVAVLLVACGIGFALHGVFLQRLRREHADVWESLGRPTLIANNSIKNCLATLRYLFSGQFRELSDPRLRRFCEFLRAYDVLYLALFAICLVSG